MYKHDEVIRAWLDGKVVQVYQYDKWLDILPWQSHTILPEFDTHLDYRIKPRTAKYRLAVLLYNGDVAIHSVNTENGEKETSKSPYFRYWLTEWAEHELLQPAGT